jgi:polysaccharide export outer membrane protein
LCGLTGCHSYVKAPTFPTDDPAYQPGGVSRDGIDKDPPVPLVLLPGDTVTVRSISNESYDYPGLVIDGEGKVHVPMAGAVEVKGLNPQQAEKKIEEALRTSDRFVRASVLVTAWGGHTATLIGAIVQEGTRALTPGMRLAEIIAAAGGPLRTGGADGAEPSYIADLDAARVVRNGQALPVSLRRALDGDPRHNVFVHPGDQIFVPAGLGSRIAVLGNVTIGGLMLTHRPGIRLTEALASAGGITLDADDNDVRVVRGALANPVVYQWNFEDFVEDRRGDIELAPGDVVFVSEHWVAQMGEVLNRLAPLLTVLTTGVNTYLMIRTIQTQNDQLDAIQDANRNNQTNQSLNGARLNTPQNFGTAVPF